MRSRQSILSITHILDILIPVYVFSIIAFSAYTSTKRIFDVFTILLLGLLVIYFLKERVFIPKQDTFILFSLLFVAFCFLSALWSTDSSRSLSKAESLVELVLSTIGIYLYLIKEKSSKRMLSYIFKAMILVAVYVLLYYNVNYIPKLLSVGRVGQEINNVNLIGQCSAIGFIGAIYLFQSTNKKMWLWTMPITLIVALGTGSRKALLYIAIGSVMIAIAKYDWRKVFKYLIIGAFVVAIFNFLLNKIDYFWVIKERMDHLFNFISGEGALDRSITGRNLMIELGWEQFRQNPILGVGINNSTSFLAAEGVRNDYYTHNNFVELLSTVGIIGFSIFYIRHIVCLIGLAKRIKYNDACLYALILLTTSFLMDYGSVSYYNKFHWFMLMLEFAILYQSKCQPDDEYSIDGEFI